MASCIYLACREQGVTRTFKEICGLTNVAKKEIGRCYKEIQKKRDAVSQVVQLDSFIARFANELELESAVKNAALQVR